MEPLMHTDTCRSTPIRQKEYLCASAFIGGYFFVHLEPQMRADEIGVANSKLGFGIEPGDIRIPKSEIPNPICVHLWFR